MKLCLILFVDWSDAASVLILELCRHCRTLIGVFRYGSVLQISAVRQALIACNSLPAVDHLSATSVRHITFEKHLDNLLVHVLRTIATDGAVARYDRDIANLLVETAADRTRAPIVKDKKDQHAMADIDAAVRQLEQQLNKVLGIRD